MELRRSTHISLGGVLIILKQTGAPHSGFSVKLKLRGRLIS